MDQMPQTFSMRGYLPDFSAQWSATFVQQRSGGYNAIVELVNNPQLPPAYDDDRTYHFTTEQCSSQQRFAQELWKLTAVARLPVARNFAWGAPVFGEHEEVYYPLSFVEPTPPEPEPEPTPQVRFVNLDNPDADVPPFLRQIMEDIRRQAEGQDGDDA